MSLSRVLAACMAALWVCCAQAWDGAQVGTVLNLEVAPATNYGVRVSLQGVTAMCGSAASWAYLNEGDSNYKVYVAALLTAKVSGLPVTVYTMKDTGTGYCRIGYLVMN